MVQTSPNNTNQPPQPCKPEDSAMPAKELSFISELIDYEKLMVKKYKAYGMAASDPNLKALFERAELMHHRHQDILTGCLVAGNKPAPTASGMC